MKEKTAVRGKITVRVLDENGNVKRDEAGFIQKLFKLNGKKIERVNHNIVTNTGDAMIADIMSNTPARTKVNSTNGHIAVGTGWSGNSPKNNNGCNNQVGSRRVMDSGYPVLKDSFGGDNDNVVVYRSTFSAGSLNNTGIDEAALMNGSTGGDCLAYAQITPEVNITLNDTLQIEWEITFLGS